MGMSPKCERCGRPAPECEPQCNIDGLREELADSEKNNEILRKDLSDALSKNEAMRNVIEAAIAWNNEMPALSQIEARLVSAVVAYLNKIEKQAGTSQNPDACEICGKPQGWAVKLCDGCWERV